MFTILIIALIGLTLFIIKIRSAIKEGKEYDNEFEISIYYVLINFIIIVASGIFIGWGIAVKLPKDLTQIKTSTIYLENLNKSSNNPTYLRTEYIKYEKYYYCLYETKNGSSKELLMKPEILNFYFSNSKPHIDIFFYKETDNIINSFSLKKYEYPSSMNIYIPNGSLK